LEPAVVQFIPTKMGRGDFSDFSKNFRGWGGGSKKGRIMKAEARNELWCLCESLDQGPKNPTKSNLIEVNRTVLKHFFMQKSNALPPRTEFRNCVRFAQTAGFVVRSKVMKTSEQTKTPFSLQRERVLKIRLLSGPSQMARQEPRPTGAFLVGRGSRRAGALGKCDFQNTLLAFRIQPSAFFSCALPEVN
jgi:hypothetical protein